MKKFATLSLLLCGSIAAMAQTEPKTKKESISKNAQLVYAVANDGQTKDGLYYVKNTANDGLWLQGHYKDGARNGTWYFFDAQNQLTMRYNYDQKKLVYLDTAALANVDVKVKTDDPVVAKNASLPIPLCSVDQLLSMAVNKIYTYYDAQNDNVEAAITAHVDTKGFATYTVAYKVRNKVANSKLSLDNEKFVIEWIPSTYKGKAVDADFIVSAVLKPNDIERYRRFRWDNE